MTSSSSSSSVELRALCKKYDVSADACTPCLAGKKPAWACTPPEEGSNAIVVYADALDAGMRLPLHPFYAKLLRHYGLAPSQLVPNSWRRYMAAFVLLCDDAGVEPLLPGPRLQAVLEVHMFFFLRSSSTPWPCPVKWAQRPRKAAICRPKLTAEAMMAVVKKLLEAARDHAARHGEELRLLKETHAKELKSVNHTNSAKVRLLKETHAKELQAANAANSAEVTRLNKEHEAELRAVKIQCQRKITSLELDQERYVKALKDMKQKITSLLPDGGRAPQEPAKGQ
ncbi:hypothetical protein PR202_gb12010 [Eleusine coracana subsp. coracana]|uniref:Transposase (putative) gypsy type domain-containing protein n=1 Tax=Eleusine coracana subsp. coracana TaxID=191504 RepID=A0AAV5EPE0_ELECO|nr:hypothetical protein PR202_gb12010 [Eleusine coracana subsp. coracana]